jgi:hypothetical protein
MTASSRLWTAAISLTRSPESCCPQRTPCYSYRRDGFGMTRMDERRMLDALDLAHRTGRLEWSLLCESGLFFEGAAAREIVWDDDQISPPLFRVALGAMGSRMEST